MKAGGRALGGSSVVTNVSEMRSRRLASLNRFNNDEGAASATTAKAAVVPVSRKRQSSKVSSHHLINLCDGSNSDTESDFGDPWPERPSKKLSRLDDFLSDASSDPDEPPREESGPQSRGRKKGGLSNSKKSSKKTNSRRTIRTEKPAPTKATDTATKEAVATTSTGNQGPQFQLATYNIYFGPEGDGEPHPDQRMKAIVHELLRNQEPSSSSSQEPPLWFIGFQEVVEPLRKRLFPALEAAGYQVIPQPDNPVGYGCAMAVYQGRRLGGRGCPTILDASWQYYRSENTNMYRGFLYVRARLPESNEQVLFATTHLESYCTKEYTGAAQRAPQLRELEAFCREQMDQCRNLQVAIVTGDMNWDDERQRSVGLDPKMLTKVLAPGWKDAWTETRTKDGKKKQSPGNDIALGYTYDPKLNPMLSGNLRRRFDRCLILDRKGQPNGHDGGGFFVEVSGANLVGKSALPGLTCERRNGYTGIVKQMPTAPSDHFGLVVTLKTTTT